MTSKGPLQPKPTCDSVIGSVNQQRILFILTSKGFLTLSPKEFLWEKIYELLGTI